MNGLFVRTGDSMQQEVLSLEKLIVKKIIRIIKNNNVEDNNNLELTMEKYYKAISEEIYSYTNDAAIQSLLRLLKFLLSFPVRHGIDTSIIVNLYRKYKLIDMITFMISQMSDESINVTTIDQFMFYIKGTSIEKLYAFYFYRINPEYIRQKYILHDVEKMTKTELYYGISTGYFKIHYGTNDAVKQLVKLSAYNVLEMLIKEGFWIIY